MSLPPKLALHQWIEFEDEPHQVVGFAESAVRLQSRSGHAQLIVVGALLADPSFRHTPRPDEITDPPNAETDNTANDLVRTGWDNGAVWDDLPEPDRDRVYELEAHLLEATTGYRSGTPEQVQPGEPREQYHPSLPVKQRMITKAAEIGYTDRRLFQLLARYREHGVAELVDKRKIKGTNPLARIDHRIVRAVREQASFEESESTGTINRFKRRVQNRLNNTHGPGVVELPSESTFRRAVTLLLPGRYTFGLAKTRQTTANKPDRSYGHVIAHRPGEIVMIDTSWLDVIAYDPITDETFTCEITVAIDLYSRSLLAWRITPLGTKGIDIGLLVADAMTPEPMRSGWPETLRYSMMWIPHERLLNIDERLAAAASRPVIYPETILVDQGMPYKSDVVRRACTSLGISYPLARKGRPTDKPEVEAVFNTIRSQFSEHVAGYKGSDVARRGRDPQAQARWTVPELEEFFAEYVVAVYQRRWHKGLTVPGYPSERLSPNQAYGFGVRLTGYVTCPTDPTLYFQLMPIAWRKITDAGVQIENLIYKDAKENPEEVLFDLRHSTSPYPNAGGKWPIRYDPRNLLHAYFHDPFKDRWVLLRWTHALDEHLPFTDNTLREVVKLIGARSERQLDQAEVAAALIDLQNRTDAPESWTTTDRRRAARDAERARAASRDHHRALAAAAGTPAQRKVPALHVVAAPDLDSDITDLDDVDLSHIVAGEVWRPGSDQEY
ncbi:hypothetical protein [Nocardia sp. NPDC050175]|uniref:hypothetical protein n=1 Tax=Nocardia sp. NPDC050175 TaxID=3364317 RepID=UPI0037A6DF00